MLKLTTAISKKIGLPDYGSRGASVGLEIELDTRLIEDPATLGEHIRRAFIIARDEVETELAVPDTSGNGNLARAVARPNRIPPGNGDRAARTATVSQIRAIRAICRNHNIDAEQLANERFAVADLAELTLQEASSLIDELKAAPSNGQNGGAR